jgi:hypothetical protein
MESVPDIAGVAVNFNAVRSKGIPEQDGVASSGKTSFILLN